MEVGGWKAEIEEIITTEEPFCMWGAASCKINEVSFKTLQICQQMKTADPLSVITVHEKGLKGYRGTAEYP